MENFTHEKYKVQSTKYKIQSTKYKVRTDLKFKENRAKSLKKRLLLKTYQAKLTTLWSEISQNMFIPFSKGELASGEPDWLWDETRNYHNYAVFIQQHITYCWWII